MKQENKQLLLADLSARLPYGVKVNINGRIEVLDSICDDDGYHFNFIGSNKEGVTIEDVKPYLFPLSSMTSKQRAELSMLVANEYDMLKSFLIEVEFYHKNNLDYRNLIDLDLAIDCTNLNIY